MSAATDLSYAGTRSLTDALQVRAEHPSWLVLAGGTDVMVPGSGLTDVPGVLDLFGVDELHGVEVRGAAVRIGACTTYAELLASHVVVDRLPLLAAAARDVGAEQIRARGTIGGNVITCSPVGDLLPGLLALDASVVLASVAATRTVPYERFVRGYRLVDLAPDEILVAVEVPLPEPGTVQHWRKVGTRAAQAVTKVAVAATARVEVGRVARFRLAFGAVADRPVRLHAVEALVEGSAADESLAEAVAAAVRDALRPITDLRSTADYRRDVAARLAARFVTGLTAPRGGPATPARG
jgi:CO/xanthine dehydrogenase FAD-binding subunit